MKGIIESYSLVEIVLKRIIESRSLGEAESRRIIESRYFRPNLRGSVSGAHGPGLGQVSETFAINRPEYLLRIERDNCQDGGRSQKDQAARSSKPEEM